MIRGEEQLSFRRSFALGFHYFIGYLYVYPFLLKTILLWLHPYATEVPPMLEWFYYLAFLIIAVWLAVPLLKSSLEKTKEYGKKETIIFLLKLLLKYYIYNFILNFFVLMLAQSSASSNQSQVVQLMQQKQIFTFFLTIVFAPIVEEIIFRGVIFQQLKQWVSVNMAIILSALSFGFLHIFQALLVGEWKEWIFLFPYSLIGIFFAYAYTKTNSIYTSIIMHMITNLIASLLVLL